MRALCFRKKETKKNRGAILLEFAFAIPVLILSLYFILDVPHIYRLSNRIHKLSELYSQCILNVVNARESKLLTLNDLKNIARGIGLGITGVVGNKKYPYTLSTYIRYVKGTTGGFTIKWTVHIQNQLESGSLTIDEDNSKNYSDVTGTNNLPGDWKNFKISNGEEKIVVETVIWAENEGLKKLFYLLPLAGSKFGNQLSAITPVKGMLDGDNAPA